MNIITPQGLALFFMLSWFAAVLVLRISGERFRDAVFIGFFVPLVLLVGWATLVLLLASRTPIH